MTVIEYYSKKDFLVFEQNVTLRSNTSEKAISSKFWVTKLNRFRLEAKEKQKRNKMWENNFLTRTNLLTLGGRIIISNVTIA